MSIAQRSRVEFLGTDPQIVSLLETADRAAASDATVLIHGESGVGKTLLAERIHAHSLRTGSRFSRFAAWRFPTAFWSRNCSATHTTPQSAGRS